MGVNTINHHIKSIYEDRELLPEATIRQYRIVQTEGDRQVARLVEHYNLDMILAVGYRERELVRYIHLNPVKAGIVNIEELIS